MRGGRRLGWLGLLLLVVSTLLVLRVALDPGPNAGVPNLYNFTPRHHHGLSPGVTYWLLGIAALSGAACVACFLKASRLGWKPILIPLVLGISCAGFLASNPSTSSADIGSYVSYANSEARGIDSYAVTPSSQNHANDSSVSNDDLDALSAEAPWQNTPNVYGPVATWVFKHAGGDGSESPRTIAQRLQWYAFTAFVLTGVLLVGCARGRSSRSRAALLWTANPLLQLHLVSAAHVDVYVAFFVVLSVALARLPLLRGASAGLAVATKATAGWAALGLVLGKPRRGRLRRLLSFLLIALLTYETASSHVFDQAHKASRYVSAGTPWRWIASLLEVFLPHGAARWLVAAAAVGTTIALATAITVAFTYWPQKGTAERAARSALIPMLAWTLVAPYQLPWYDAVVWSLLAASVAMGVDWLVLIHTTVLTLAYLPGRIVPLGTLPHDVQIVVRSGLSPVVVGLCAALCVWTLRRSRGVATAEV